MTVYVDEARRLLADLAGSAGFWVLAVIALAVAAASFIPQMGGERRMSRYLVPGGETTDSDSETGGADSGN